MSAQSLMCPAGSTVLERRSRMPCSAGAVGPRRHVSIGFNKRLERRTTVINGRPFLTTAYLTSGVLHQPDVPLLFDVDGEEAAGRDVAPYYSAPPLLNDKVIDAYEAGLYWFPAFRHRGRMKVGFIGGHVLSTSSPLEEPWWRWSLQPGQ
jgi:hypothetical protein